MESGKTKHTPAYNCLDFDFSKQTKPTSSILLFIIANVKRAPLPI